MSRSRTEHELSDLNDNMKDIKDLLKELVNVQCGSNKGDEILDYNERLRTGSF